MGRCEREAVRADGGKPCSVAVQRSMVCVCVCVGGCRRLPPKHRRYIDHARADRFSSQCGGGFGEVWAMVTCGERQRCVVEWVRFTYARCRDDVMTRLAGAARASPGVVADASAGA